MASVVLSLPSTHSLAFAMALQFSLSPSPALRSYFFSSSSSSTSTSTAASTAFASPGAPRRIAAVRGERRRARVAAVRSRLETAEVAVGQVTEVNNDTFWPIVKAAGSKIVVLDMYTQWCGPCKVMAPKFQELSKKYLDVVFLKLDCNQGNRPLAKELGIRVVPTFKILKDNKVVEEVRGAKLDDLVLAIEAAKSG